ncbi:6TM ABC transporter family protein [Loigolactobacillus jiayinensis]|uniref:ABC transmembrane type-1 domain-containing protein n=1 Tax=Loigolactobacillus jiayinensis TaxID=2486016 RepID=A0ABW1RGQ1_9LACO|nr:hypothetical protein [Loigolactobacillus jiayinensis]
MQEQKFEQQQDFQSGGRQFQGPQPGQDFQGPPRRSGFDFKGFLGLIRNVKPRYWQLVVGLVLGLIATSMQLLVPKIAQQLINQLGHHVNMMLVVGVLALFVLSAIFSAVAGTTLGIFGENVVAKLRDFLWAKIL